jgi:hypothetical protein
MVTERGVHFAHFLRHCAASAAASPIKPRILAEQKVNGTFFFAQKPRLWAWCGNGNYQFT